MTTQQIKKYKKNEISLQYKSIITLQMTNYIYAFDKLKGSINICSSQKFEWALLQ